MSLETRIDACLRLLTQAARDANMLITGDGRISEADAAKLLCYAPATLANMRSEGKGPPSYFRGAGGGSKCSYRLADLAHWIETMRSAGVSSVDFTELHSTLS